MKLRASILEVRDNGDELFIKMQADEAAAAEWRPMVPVEIRISSTPRNAKTFHVGRPVEIELTPL